MSPFFSRLIKRVNFVIENNIQFFYAFITLSLSAFFSASETALFSIAREQIPSFKSSKNDSLRKVFWLLSNGQQTLIVILVGNLAVNIITVGVINGLVERFFPNGGLWLTLLTATGAILVFGEVLPKNLAVGHGLTIAKAVSYPLYYFSKFLMPLVSILQILNTFFISIFSRYLRTPSPFITEEELAVGFEKSLKDGAISELEHRLLNSVIAAGHRTVSTILIHRSELLYVEPSDSLFEVRDKMVDSSFWFCAVKDGGVEGGIDGFVFLEDIKRFAPKEDRSLFFEKGISVSETMEVADVVVVMQEQAQRVATVQDEFSSVVGVVTLKMAVNSVLPVGDNRVKKSDHYDKVRVFNGKDELVDIDDWIPKTMQVEAQKHRTLNGLITSHLGRIPNKQEEFAIGGSIFYIMEADGRVINSVRIERGN